MVISKFIYRNFATLNAIKIYKNKEMSVIGIGNALMDILVHIPSDKILSDLNLSKAAMHMIDLERHHNIVKLIDHLPKSHAAGGSAANTINGLAKLGVDTAFIGKVGRDHTGQLFCEDQRTNNIKTIIEVTDENPSGKCISMISPCGERTMATFLGAAICMNENSVDRTSIRGYKVLYVEGYLIYNQPLIEAAMSKAKEEGLIVALDLASYTVVADNMEFLNYLIDKYVDIVFANEEEAREFTSLEADQALNHLSERCHTAVVKIGAEGSLIASGEQRHRVGVIDATPIDKTGAGDLYAAGFLYGLCKGLPLKMCGDIGAVLSSKVVEIVGAKMEETLWCEIRELVMAIERGEEVVRY